MKAMRMVPAAWALCLACSGSTEKKITEPSDECAIEPIDAGVAPSTCGSGSDLIQEAYDAVDQQRLTHDLQVLTGAVPVSICGKDTLLNNRYLSDSKRHWRHYFKQYFAGLGIPVQELAYPTAHAAIEQQGHNLEAVIAGDSADSVVIIVHYDSMGARQHEAENPGVDDDMTGMVSLFETARILADPCRKLQKTLRLVASDYEEWPAPVLEGARSYAAYLSNLAHTQGFQIVASVDYEQSGWNCAIDGMCTPEQGGTRFDLYSCSGDSHHYDSPALADEALSIVNRYSTLAVDTPCLSSIGPKADTDLTAMWEIGVPSVTTSETFFYGTNPHFDYSGGDTIDRIDFDYLTKIARVNIALAARLAGAIHR